MDRSAFTQIVAETAYRPAGVEAVRAALLGQSLYHVGAPREGLDDLAVALAELFGDGLEAAQARLTELSAAHPRQPLCHYYAFAASRQAGDGGGAADSLVRLREADPGDPMAEQLRLHLEGQEIPAVCEEVRLANLGRLAATPLLRNPYQIAVGAVFEAIRHREHARVLDIGVGSGAQMCELMKLLASRRHEVRSLEIVGLDFVDDFLETAERAVLAQAERLERIAVTYVPIRARIEALDRRTSADVRTEGPLDAANATIALHEVPGEAKLAAIDNLRLLAPRRLVIAEWNYCLENVLPETGVEFLFNVRRVAAALVAALRERYPFDEARAVVGDWLSQAGGQLTCPAAERQECFLDVQTWARLLALAGFRPVPVDSRLLAYAESGDRARVEKPNPWVATSWYAESAPIALIEAVC